MCRTKWQAKVINRWTILAFVSVSQLSFLCFLKLLLTPSIVNVCGSRPYEDNLLFIRIISNKLSCGFKLVSDQRRRSSNFEKFLFAFNSDFFKRLYSFIFVIFFNRLSFKVININLSLRTDMSQHFFAPFYHMIVTMIFLHLSLDADFSYWSGISCLL